MTYPYEPKSFHMHKEIARILHAFLDPEHIDWDPKEQHTLLGEGFIVPLSNKDVLLHDYHLHRNNTTAIRNYQLLLGFD
jgi:hypothetical protein